MVQAAVACYRGLKLFCAFRNGAQRLTKNSQTPVCHILCVDSAGKASLSIFRRLRRDMPRFSRENTIEEKRRMRNQRNKRKRQLRAEKQREAEEIRGRKERAAYSRAKELAPHYYGKWRQSLAEQNISRTLDKTKVSFLNVKM